MRANNSLIATRCGSANFFGAAAGCGVVTAGGSACCLGGAALATNAGGLFGAGGGATGVLSGGGGGAVAMRLLHAADETPSTATINIEFNFVILCFSLL